MIIDVVGGEELLFSQNYACEDCGISIEELTPRLFSFNNPHGACPTCMGLGTQLKIDPELVIPNRSLSINQGAIHASGWNGASKESISGMYFSALGKEYGFDLDTPIEKMDKKSVDALLYGTKGKKLKLSYNKGLNHGTLYQAFEGIIPNLERRFRETQSEAMRRDIEDSMAAIPCPDCEGKRLKKESLSVTVGGISIYEYTTKSIVEAVEFVDSLTLTPREKYDSREDSEGNT